MSIPVKLSAILGACLTEVRLTLQPFTEVNFLRRLFVKPLFSRLLHVFLLELFIYLRVEFFSSWARFLGVEKLIIK